jgi:hypothetical protein
VSNGVKIPIYMGAGEKQCGKNKLTNYEISCQSPGGIPSFNPCLNRLNACRQGQGCDPNINGKCQQMDSDIRTLVGYIKANMISSSGQILIDEENFAYTNTKNFLDRFNSYGLSISSIMQYVDNDMPFSGDSDIACASAGSSQECLTDKNNIGRQYSCTSAGPGCLVWSWVTGGGQQCPNGCQKGTQGPLSACDTGQTITGNESDCNLGNNVLLTEMDVICENDVVKRCEKGKLVMFEDCAAKNQSCSELLKGCAGVQSCGLKPQQCQVDNDNCETLCGPGWQCQASGYGTSAAFGESQYAASDQPAPSASGLCVDMSHQQKFQQQGNQNPQQGQGQNQPQEQKKQEDQEKAAQQQKEQQTKEEQQKQDRTAPKVTVTEPASGSTISKKTADLKATTDIKANCTYSDKTGSLSGMTMSSSDGYQHTATLSNLAQGTAADCKYQHSITVTCKNQLASANATAATGTGQTSFTVDLSKDTANAPKVASGMESDKITIANPVLKAITDRPSECEYKKGVDFTFGSGTKFETTGDYNHNAQLKDLTEKDNPHIYYVACKDKETCAKNSPGLQIKFTVTLEKVKPNIESTTPATQTAANPTLSVTTDIPATCQYKKDSTFTYGDSGATQFTNDSDYSHTSSLTSLPDAKYTFYVACKAKESAATKTMEQPIVTELKRTVNPPNAPVISNTTPNIQNTATPVLSVTTAAAATCQYKEGSDFTYGSGTQFTTDGGIGHSVTLTNLADGTHTFYVVCKDVATGTANTQGTQIMFTTTSAPQTCASLTANDKQNDDERDPADSDDRDSKYLWRSVEGGTREKFPRVDWYAGYQFTPSEKGQVTQLCGYFGDGNTNKVSLYNGSYKELASAQISGANGWKCVSISPVQVSTDKRYYVIARVKDNPIYYEYKANLLPRDAENASVDVGVRQLANEPFGGNIRKYDYMIFGLVDVMIKPISENTTGPEITSPSPIGSISTNSTVISVQTSVDATCKFDRDDVEYGKMRYTFSVTAAKLHQQKVCQLDDGPFTWYVRCKSASGTNNASTPIQFEVPK